MHELTVITRNSQLAMWQANYVVSQLKQYYPQMAIEIMGISTQGDRILDQSLEKIGGKGLFIKELEHHLLAGSADVAVHSLKDLPAKLPDNLQLSAVLAREVATDVLVSNRYPSLESIPQGGIIGTSSARRRAILARHYPQLQVKLLRGNLQTRLTKLDNGEYDAIILAAAGLLRLGLKERITAYLDPALFIPAIGQGVLGLEIKAENELVANMLQVLHDPLAAALIGAEREMGRYLNASCNIPIAGHAQLIDGQLRLHGMIADSEAGLYYEAKVQGALSDYLELGARCATQLLEQGAAAIVAKYAAH